MKLALSVLWQTVLLVVVAFGGFVAGMFVPAIRLQHVVSRTATHLRSYDFGWIVPVLLVYLLLLVISAARKRLRSGWVGTTVALVLTVAIIVLFTQLGVKDTPLGQVY